MKYMRLVAVVIRQDCNVVQPILLHTFYRCFVVIVLVSNTRSKSMNQIK